MPSPLAQENLWATRPTLDEFIRIVRDEFGFLISDFGFGNEPLPATSLQNEFQVRFVSPASRVIVEGRSFGTSISVKFERSEGGRANLVDILLIRDAEAAGPLRKFGDQRVLLHHAAVSTRQHAEDAIRGKPEIYQAAEALRQQRIERLHGPNTGQSS